MKHKYEFKRIGDEGRIQRRTWWSLWTTTQYMVHGGQYWFSSEEYARSSWLPIGVALRVWNRMFPDVPEGAIEAEQALAAERDGGGA